MPAHQCLREIVFIKLVLADANGKKHTRTSCHMSEKEGSEHRTEQNVWSSFSMAHSFTAIATKGKNIPTDFLFTTFVFWRVLAYRANAKACQLLPTFIFIFVFRIGITGIRNDSWYDFANATTTSVFAKARCHKDATYKKAHFNVK